jgi:hypothetical protein
MKKVLVVLGIGLVAVVLAVVGSGVASGWWDDAPGDGATHEAVASPGAGGDEQRAEAAAGKESAGAPSGRTGPVDLQKQREALAALERAYPFNPPEGQVL